MKTTICFLLIAFLARPLGAADNLTTLLQKGLFEEEANQNLEAAIESYRALADQFTQSRKIAATAVFRLGECYRKLGRTNDAIAQYQAVLRDYSDQETLTKLSRQNLAGLGGTSASGATGTPEASSLAAREAGVARLRQALTQLKDEASAQALVVAQIIEPDSVLNPLTEQRLKVEQEMAQLSESFGPEHPQLRAAQARRDTIKKQIADRLDAIRAGLATRLAAEEALVTMLRADLDPTRAGKSSATSTQPVMSEEEEKELRRITVLIRDSPDLINSSANFGPTLLQQAVAKGQVHVVRELLAHGADPNLAPVPANWPPTLHSAAGAGHTAVVTELLNGHADVNGRNAQGETPLHVAAAGGFRVLAETLIARGAELDAKDNLGDTPLHKAARSGHKAVAEMLLQRGAKVDARSTAGETPLFRAAQGQAALVTLLAGAGAAVNLTNNFKYSPLHAAVMSGQVRAMEALLAAGAEPDRPGPGDETALHRAAGDLRDSAVEVLLKAGANPNATNEWGVTPLLKALRKPSSSELPAVPRVVERLLQAGASPNPPRARGGTPLHTAVERPGEGLVPLLLRYKPDLEARDEQGFSPLERAILTGRADTVQALLDAGADPNATHPTNGETPLHWAVRVGDPKLVKLLLDHKANPNVTTRAMETPWTTWRDEWVSGRQLRDAAAKAKAAGIPDLLREAGADETYHLRHVISVRKRSGNYTRVIFRPDTNGWNRFTLLELIAQVYSDRSSEAAEQLVFPDFARVRLTRADAKSAATNAVVDVMALLRATNCAGDVALTPGDIVEIGETDHTVSERWGGLDDATRDALSRCLIRYVEIVIEKERTRIRLFPWFQQHYSQRSSAKHGEGTHENISPNPADGVERGRGVFWLSYLLRDFNLLRVSSDTSRVRVRRTASATGGPGEILFDLPAFQRQADETRDVRLRDGDIIEVPEK